MMIKIAIIVYLINSALSLRPTNEICVGFNIEQVCKDTCYCGWCTIMQNNQTNGICLYTDALCAGIFDDTETEYCRKERESNKMSFSGILMIIFAVGISLTFCVISIYAYAKNYNILVRPALPSPDSAGL